METSQRILRSDEIGAARDQEVGMVIARMAHTEWLQINELCRGEFINFPPAELDLLYAYIQDQGIRFGIHCPLFQPTWLEEKGLYLAMLDQDTKRRRLFFRLVEENLEWGSRWEAEYVLVHIQRMMLFDTLQNGELSTSDAEALVWEGAARLDELSQQYGIPIYVENALGCPFFYESEQYIALFERFPRLRFCLDIGHLLVDATLYHFRADRFIEQIAPYIRSLHLYNKPALGKLENVTFEQFQKLRQKFPVHPSQSPADGWNDTETFLRIVLRNNEHCIINFEVHPSLYPDYTYTQEGIRWVKALRRQILAQC